MTNTQAEQLSSRSGGRRGASCRRRILALLFAPLAVVLLVAPERGRTSAPKQCPEADDAARLLETGRAAEVRTPKTLPAELRIVSYNMRWRGGEDLRRLIEVLRADEQLGGAHVIGLQEADRGRKRSGGVNAARLIAEALGMYYAWAAPPSDGKKSDDREAGEDETGVAILSLYPFADVERIVLPHGGPGCRRRAAVGATVKLGDASVRFYSLHAETRLPVARKVEQWRAVVDSLAARSRAGEPAVVVGDFNTIKGKDVKAARRLFAEAGFTTPFPDDESTWHTFIFDLKLDWFWLRGLDATGHGIARHVGFSDHWPLWARVKLPPAAAGGAAPVTK